MALEAMREYQMRLKLKWSNRDLQKTNVQTNTVNLLKNSKKSPPIPIHGHGHIKSYTNNATQKSNSYPSSSILNHSHSKMTASPSMTQLEANTQYNKGRNNNESERESMKSNGTANSHMTYSLLTETTDFNDMSEPRTSNAFSVQTGAVLTPIVYTKHSNSDTVQVMTPVSDSDSDIPTGLHKQKKRIFECLKTDSLV